VDVLLIVLNVNAKRGFIANGAYLRTRVADLLLIVLNVDARWIFLIGDLCGDFSLVSFDVVINLILCWLRISIHKLAFDDNVLVDSMRLAHECII
jgi:hypothetical protein